MIDLEKILLPVTNVFISLEDISYPLLFHLCCLIRRFMIHNQICDKDVYNGDVDKKLMEYFSFSYLLNFVVNCERGYIKGWKERKSNELTLKFTIFEISNREKKIYRNIFLINSCSWKESWDIFIISLVTTGKNKRGEKCVLRYKSQVI